MPPNNYEDMAGVLNPFRFEQTKPGHFRHPLVDEEFDFTASSIYGLVYQIYEAGRTQGRQDIKDDIRSLLT